MVHGLLDRIFLMLRVSDYFLKEISDSTFFPGRAAGVYLGKAGAEDSRRVGEIGVLHPEVLEKFDLRLVPVRLSFVNGMLTTLL
jgi:phenylalanyl-tRNA synthetase beta chain